MRFSHVEPTSEEFFKTADKIGGPVEPTLGFKEVYTEIYIKRAKQPEKKNEELTANDGNEQTDNKNDDNTLANGEEDKDDNDCLMDGDKEGEADDLKLSGANGETTYQQSIQGGQPEKIKKKRGRKPKSFYI